MIFKDILSFMVKNNIKDNEFFILMSLYYYNLDKEIPALIKKYSDKYGVEENFKRTMYSKEEKEKLVEKGFLENTGNGYTLTDKFLDLFVTEYIAGTEIIDTYPGFTIINHQKIPLKTTNRAELRKLYWEAINGNRYEHLEVLKDVEYGITNKMLNMNIEKFISSEFWKDIRKERKIVNESHLIKKDL